MVAMVGWMMNINLNGSLANKMQTVWLLRVLVAAVQPFIKILKMTLNVTFNWPVKKMPYCPKYLEPPIQDVYCDTDIEMCIIKFQK